MDFVRFVHKLFGWKCFDEVNILSDRVDSCENHLDKAIEQIGVFEVEKRDLNLQINKHKQDLVSVNLELEKYKRYEWTNPFDLRSVVWKYRSIGDLEVPVQSFLTVNDPEIVKLAKRLDKGSAIETAKSVERWLFRYIKYTPDKDNEYYGGQNEFFGYASFILASKKEDCDGIANLFYSLMHAAGYGKLCLCAIGEVKWHTGERFAHDFNYVWDGHDWMFFDGNAGASKKLKVWYPYLKEWVLYNYWGTFSWGN